MNNTDNPQYPPSAPTPQPVPQQPEPVAAGAVGSPPSDPQWNTQQWATAQWTGQPAPGQQVPGQQWYPGPGAGVPGAAGAGWPPTTAPLSRSRTDRMIGGVCGGLARYWNTDPVLLRILAVVITLFTGGAFILVYLLAWLLIPAERAGSVAPGELGQPAGPPRERSHLGWLVLSVAVLVAGLLGLLALVLPTDVGMWGVTLGITLAILGAGLLIGTTRGRARWLVIPAVPLAFITFGVVSASNWVAANPDWDAVATRAGQGGVSIGERIWSVTPTQALRGGLDYNLSVGEATLDLTELGKHPAKGDTPGDVVPITAAVGLGQLIVLVPPDVEVRLTGSVKAGEIITPGQPRGTGGADSRPGEDLKVTEIIKATTGSPNHIIELDAAVGVGALEVRREAS